ncbi:MAG: TlpA family protein disulfide reductase [Gammaproteobacteria bacterium]|nr:MAG: TlpA family protein disulfide reductase [Gammaproteobacteria bacterium]
MLSTNGRLPNGSMTSSNRSVVSTRPMGQAYTPTRRVHQGTGPGGSAGRQSPRDCDRLPLRSRIGAAHGLAQPLPRRHPPPGRPRGGRDPGLRGSAHRPGCLARPRPGLFGDLHPAPARPDARLLPRPRLLAPGRRRAGRALPVPDHPGQRRQAGRDHGGPLGVALACPRGAQRPAPAQGGLVAPAGRAGRAPPGAYRAEVVLLPHPATLRARRLEHGHDQLPARARQPLRPRPRLARRPGPAPPPADGRPALCPGPRRPSRERGFPMRRYLATFLLCCVLAPGRADTGRPDAFQRGLRTVDPPLAARDFALADVNDGTYRFSAHHGHVRVVNFWATWCPPCRREMPSLERAWKRLAPRGIEVVAVNVGEDEDTVFAFMGQYPMDFPVLLDEAGRVVEQWPVRALPTTFVVDPRGCIRYRALGGRRWDDPALLEKIEALASAPPVPCRRTPGN